MQSHHIAGLILMLSTKPASNQKNGNHQDNSNAPHSFDSDVILRFFLVLSSIAIGIALVSWGINQVNNYFYQVKKKGFLMDDPHDAIVNEVMDLLFTYHRMAIILHSIYILLGATTILSSVFVTAFLNSNATIDTVPITTYLPLISFVSTASISLITAFSLGNKSNNSRKAWRLLSTALDNYLTADKEDTAAKSKAMQELIEERGKAENIVGTVDFKY